MVKYTHLNRDPGKAMEDLVKKLSASSKGQKTKPTGVKDLGDAGDVVWTREDGSEQSARLIDVDLEEARAAVSELRDVTMPALADELSDARTDLQQKLDAANARIDDIIVDGGGAGNFTTYSINEPSSDGTGEGDQWFRVVNGEVIGQWRWDGAAWVPVTLTDAIIAGIDLSKLVGNGGLSEVVANRMFADIFTANKITSQEIAAGSITTEKIAAEGIVADVIQGGAFTGETFTGGTFTGGLFKTSDALPGQVMLADDAVDNDLSGGAIRPGIRVTPTDTSDMVYPASIGPGTHGLTIYGGRRTTGGRSIVVCNPGASFLRTFREDGTTGGEVQTSPDESFMRTYREDGTIGGVIQTSLNNSYMRTLRADGTSYALGSQYNEVSMRRVNSDGVETAAMYVNDSSLGMVRNADDGSASYGFRVNASGVWAEQYGSGGGFYNLLETAKDSGWINLAFASGFENNSGGANLQYRLMGNMIHLRGRVQRTSGNFEEATAYLITTLPSAIRPPATQRSIVAGGNTTRWCRMEVVAGSGGISVAAMSGPASWIDVTGTSWTVD